MRREEIITTNNNQMEEKGNALITRAAARDLYDWCNMLSESLFEEQRDLFRKCFLFYMTISADTLN